MKCQLCERETDLIRRHHLIPENRKQSDVIQVCRQCGSQVHLLFTNKELEKELYTVDKLKDNPKMKKYLDWVKDKPIEKKYCIKKKKRRLK